MARSSRRKECRRQQRPDNGFAVANMVGPRALGCCCRNFSIDYHAATFILGGVIGQQQLYQTWTERKLEGLATILRSADFEGVEAGFSSAAQVYLTGTVTDNAVRKKLHEQLVVTFGTEEADEMIWRVDVAR